MSALAEARSYLCQCGCGREINPSVRKVHGLLARGYKVMQISRELGIDKAQIRQYRVNPPRYLKGHFAKGSAKPLVKCANPQCDRTFRKLGPNHLYCTYASSKDHQDERAQCARLAYQHKDDVWRQHDEVVGERVAKRVIESERKRAQSLTATLDEIVLLGGDYETAAILARSAVERGKWKRSSLPTLRYSHAQETFEQVIAVERSRFQRDIEKRVGDLLGAVRWRYEARDHDKRLTAAAVARDPELAELVAQQERDRRWGDRMPKWVLSLDATVGDDATFGSFVAGHESDPCESLVASAIRDQLGGYGLDEIESLDENTLRWLRAKLVDSGLVSFGVTDTERELWAPPAPRTTRKHVDDAVTKLGLGGAEDADIIENRYSLDGIARREWEKSVASPNARKRKGARDFARRERALLKRLRRWGVAA